METGPVPAAGITHPWGSTGDWHATVTHDHVRTHPETKWAVQPFTAFIDSCMWIQTEPHKRLVCNALHKHTTIRLNIKYTNISTYFIGFSLSQGILGFAFPMKCKNVKGYPVLPKPVLEDPCPASFVCLPHLTHLIPLISSLVETARTELGVSD